MLKPLFYILILFMLFSCKENDESKELKLYFKKYSIYEKTDSSSTNINVYIGEIDGHKYRYHLFNGKNKSQMEIEHVTDECKKCLKKSNKNG